MACASPGSTGHGATSHGATNLYEQEEVERLLSGFPSVDVFVAYNSPRNIHERNTEVHVGFEAFNRYIERAQPRPFIHGHPPAPRLALKLESNHVEVERVLGQMRGLPIPIPKAACSIVQSVVMKSSLRKLGLAGLLVTFAVSLPATNSPAPITPANTNFINPEIVDDNPQVKQLMEVMKKEGIKTDNLLDEQFLFASLLWGSVGAGYLLYARKQRQMVPFIGGVAMIGVSYFVGSWFWMSILCIALMVGVYQLMKRGY